MTHQQEYSATTEQVDCRGELQALTVGAKLCEPFVGVYMEKIKFTKMNGLGNDFIIIDYEDFEKIKRTPSELALKL